MVLKRLSPQEARTRLEELTQRATTTEPNLAQKLAALSKWIEPKKDGLLVSKPYVLDLLTEVIGDSEIWFGLRSLSDSERQQFYASENFSVTEQYWLEVLFPRWISDPDPKFPNWRREVMNGNFRREDARLLKSLGRELTRKGGSYLWRHLLDLSMATDLLASGQRESSLCVQLTTISEPHLDQKRQAWEMTLQFWCIERGLLISYNPMENDLVDRLAATIFDHSNSLAMVEYFMILV
ncbi:hypothetical protein VB712_01805 [Spirulina sp. CCNP1310]|uniref:hypothetical protein n=1 Tax=Spirulina sp. CCNP1310 TaxID=3110249 RepID=UPI002B1FDD5A|nr:hypothetical protein [Spirulina sp. CCNP1310]MEA5417939.1 hypothetical protein [Spirulina sp. CCNP1310]